MRSEARCKLLVYLRAKMFYMRWHANRLRVKISFQVSRPPIITCHMMLYITSNKTVVRPNDKRLLKKNAIASFACCREVSYDKKISQEFFFSFFERWMWNRRRNGNDGLYWTRLRISFPTFRKSYKYNHCGPLTTADVVPPVRKWFICSLRMRKRIKLESPL